MALKATIFKAELQIANMDRNYYHEHTLTIARHPSETDERMMVRLLAYALHADEALSFGKGLSTDDEPDLWRKDLTGAIELWIDVGQPDEKRIRRACGRARKVFVYSYGGHGAAIWWDQVGAKLERARNLSVVSVPAADSQALAKLARRNMQLNCTVQDEQVWLGNALDRVQVHLGMVKVPSAPSR
ncbi:MAG: YaeQ family protein [Giesbergeria sp.]